ncbi:hypothetical protein [Flavobacterium sp. '19STA2R22 D10 B1']|uniref:hypothetical protein n=1 Tax=Flavobacterium aerium TaxID=3037261 RepID=UPI00278C0EF1|nr:hypothetical protein [Flavobacterium sp. '19STA2R22 D10 B1']
MITAETQKSSNWFSKFAICFLAIVGAVNSSLTVVLPLLPGKLAQFINMAGVLSLLIALLFSIIFPFYWHYKEKKGTFNSTKCLAWLTILLRYWLAFQISVYGFEKIFDVNFAYSYHLDNSLLDTLTGQELTWKYYGYSFGLSLIISLFQIFGSIFLLFRRTVLLGVVTLLPVFFNIVLINIFYSIGPITIFISILITLGLTYLLLQRKKEVIALFTQYKNTLPSLGSKTLRAVARILCIVIPCLFVMYYSYGVRLSEKYFGKWKVETMKRNGEIIAENAWEKDSLAWKVIYFEERGKLYYGTNPYMYVDSTTTFMKYLYDDKKDALQVIYYDNNPAKPDTIPVQIEKFEGKSMQWNMILNKDTVQMNLKKME